MLLYLRSFVCIHASYRFSRGSECDAGEEREKEGVVNLDDCFVDFLSHEPSACIYCYILMHQEFSLRRSYNLKIFGCHVVILINCLTKKMAHFTLYTK